MISHSSVTTVVDDDRQMFPASYVPSESAETPTLQLTDGEEGGNGLFLDGEQKVKIPTVSSI